MNHSSTVIFKFKHFNIEQSDAVLKVGTDAFVLGALIHASTPLNILDIGAGTGVLSLIAAQKFSSALIDAVEIDDDSVELAARNFSNSNWENRLTIHHCSVQNYFPNKSYDLIISNPPFFENSSAANTAVKNRVKHNNSLSAVDLLSAIAKLLSLQGECWLILSVDFITTYLAEIEKQGLFIRKEINIYGKPTVLKRKVLRLTKTNGICQTENFVIRDERGNYSSQYINLTKELHDRALKA